MLILVGHVYPYIPCIPVPYSYRIPLPIHTILEIGTQAPDSNRNSIEDLMDWCLVFPRLLVYSVLVGVCGFNSRYIPGV